MPEGPEILITSQYLTSKIRGKYITNAKILSGRYTHQTLKGFDLLKGDLKISKIDSKGKFMWITLKDNNNDYIYILNTFGMAGEWSFKKNDNSRVKFKLKNKKTDKEHILYFNDVRNFGSLTITKNKNDLKKKIDSLGIDLIKSELSLNEMVNHITSFIDKKKKNKRKSNNNIVNILMSQEVNKGIGCGIGNYLCAEILYDAGISPHRDIIDLNNTEIKNLAESIRKIMKEAYVNNATKYLEKLEKFMSNHYDKIKKGNFPDYYSDIAIQNKKFVFKVYGKTKDPEGNNVKGENIYSDRTTWWVPSKQK